MRVSSVLFEHIIRILISITAFQCLILGRDVDGRVTGDSTMAKNFKVVVTNSDNSTLATPQVSYFGSAFHFAFKANTTGQYKVSITYLDDEVPKGKYFQRHTFGFDPKIKNFFFSYVQIIIFMHI